MEKMYVCGFYSGYFIQECGGWLPLGFHVFMALILIEQKGCCEMNWWVFVVYGAFLGALDETLTSLGSYMKDRDAPILVQQCWIAWISSWEQDLLDIPLVGGTFMQSNNQEQPFLVKD